MAQQTINIGASPNDGTGTPLRTAFQYTNSNFSELYTAVGPSGNNIVVPGSATITGDLTVDTNVLKVDSANNRVGIGTASPTVPLYVTGNNATATAIMQDETNGAKLRLLANSINFDISNGGGGGDIAVSGANPFTFRTNGSERYRIASDGIATWSNVGGVAGTAMTLNATGLGVGTSPATGVKLDVNGFVRGTSGAVFQGANNITTGSGLELGYSGSYSFLQSFNRTGAAYLPIRLVGSSIDFDIANSVKATIDTSGNLGIGVTPSGSGGCLQLKSGITFPATQVASSDANTLDDYEEGTWTGTLAGGTTSPTTPVTATGRYTKIGRQVNLQIEFSNVNTTGASGSINVTGVPFTNSAIVTFGVLQSSLGASFTGTIGCYLAGSGVILVGSETISNSARLDSNHNAGTGRYFWFNITYTVA